MPKILDNWTRESWQQLTLPFEVIDIEEDEESEVDSEKHKG